MSKNKELILAVEEARKRVDSARDDLTKAWYDWSVHCFEVLEPDPKMLAYVKEAEQKRLRLKKERESVI
ncbi:hypothetical protein LCGC14_0145740 [marine sediment metagenome]|uniref:Uncharacterized protein n=1 Tax=marine sediment metagenome TaxID=412755 RepID=A0A0F9Y1C1_9ZZZZ